MTVSVKVTRVPGVPTEVVLEDGATVGDALRAANITVASNERLTVSDTESTTGALIRTGDVILITSQVKGN